MTIAVNRRAKFDYFLEESFEAGIQLLGTEASVVRHRGMSLAEAFVIDHDGELYLHNCQIAAHENAHRLANHEPKRDRKLLLRKREIGKLLQARSQKGYAIVPVKAYYKGGKVKIEIAIGKGKREFDKRETIKRRIADREADAAMRDRSI